MRRVKITGNTTFMDYCTAGPQYASGGFMADSVTGTIINGSQQQFLVRNSSIGTLVERGVEPGLRRRAGCARAVLPAARRTRRWPPRR